MKHMDRPVNKAATPFLPHPASAPTSQDIQLFMETSRAQLIQLENMLSLKLAAEQDVHAHCPTPSAPPATELQLHLDGASEQ